MNSDEWISLLIVIRILKLYLLVFLVVLLGKLLFW